MPYTHGVYIQERATRILAPVLADSAVQFVVGTAPVHTLADPSASVNKPVLCYSLEEFVTAFGWSEDFECYSLCQAASASFQVFNVAPLVVVNVFNPLKGKQSHEAVPVTLTDGMGVLPVADVIRATVAVTSSDGQITYKPYIDYELAYNDAGYLVIAVIDGGAITDTTIQVKYDTTDTTGVTDNDVIGGYDAQTGTYTGLELVRQCYSRLGLIPGQILAPGFSHHPAVGAAMMAKTTGINGVFSAVAVADIDSAQVKTYDKAQAWKNDNGYVDKNLILCWPKVKVGGRGYYLSALFAALTAQTDAEYESTPFASPSNRFLRISGAYVEGGGEVFLEQTQANHVNGGGIVTVLNINGWRLWGNNTSVYPAVSDPKDRWVPIRRAFNWWGNSFILTYFQKVDSPMNRRLIQTILDTENIRANGYVARDMIAGAKIEFVEAENTTTDIVDGTLRFHQYLTPYPPAETIINTLEFDPDTFKASLGGV